jgi:hypothetical protein
MQRLFPSLLIGIALLACPDFFRSPARAVGATFDKAKSKESTAKKTSSTQLPAESQPEKPGKITGRVLDSKGKPIINMFGGWSSHMLYLYAIPCDKAGKPRTSLYDPSNRHVIGQDGRFELPSLAPGNYLLLVSDLETSRSRDATRVSFYPGVADAGKAKIVTVQAGKSIQNIRILLLRR